MVSRELLLIVFGGLIVAHVLTSIGEALIGKGVLELEREALNRVYKREAGGAVIWKSGEMLAMVIMFAGLFKVWSGVNSLGGGRWGIPAVAIGFTLFCLANVIRGWVCHNAYAREAPGTKACRGALIAGVLTTLAECAVAFAVCGYIYTHLPKTRPATQDPGDTAATDDKPKPKPAAPPAWVNEDEALKLMKNRNHEYLKAISAPDRQDVRARKNEKGELEYLRDDIEKLKDAGMPTWEELNLKNPNPDEKKKLQEDN